jgi:hypothetical protein
MNAPRPERLDEFVGQESAKRILSVLIAAAKRRNEPVPHLLMSGSAGLGKTSLARIVAHEMNGRLVETVGSSVKNTDVIHHVGFGGIAEFVLKVFPPRALRDEESIVEIRIFTVLSFRSVPYHPQVQSVPWSGLARRLAKWLQTICHRLRLTPSSQSAITGDLLLSLLASAFHREPVNPLDYHVLDVPARGYPNLYDPVLAFILSTWLGIFRKDLALPST